MREQTTVNYITMIYHTWAPPYEEDDQEEDDQFWPLSQKLTT